jgi:nucleoside-diphosphate-sugar epimerase
VLLTGATGFVGRQAVQPLLERGFEVHALARTVPVEPGAEPVSWHEADLLDPVATGAVIRELGATHLLHFAWYAKHGRFWHAPENLDWVAASLQLLRSFHASGGRRVVIAGTCAEYDWNGDCCDERTPLTPASLYGVSKNALRAILEEYARAAGLSAAWGRIFFTFGPGEQPTRVIAAVARALVRGETVPCSSGAQVRDFLYVEDVASAFAALLDSAATGPFDIGSGEAVALRTLLERLQRLAGREQLVRFGEAPHRNEPARIVADSRRLRDELGWSPKYILDEGLERTLAWWRSASSATVG